MKNVRQPIIPTRLKALSLLLLPAFINLPAQVNGKKIWSENFAGIEFSGDQCTIHLGNEEGYSLGNAIYYSTTSSAMADIYIYKQGNNERYIYMTAGKSKLRIVIPYLKNACGELTLSFSANFPFYKEGKTKCLVQTNTPGAEIKTVENSGTDKPYKVTCTIGIDAGTESLELLFQPLKTYASNAHLSDFNLSATDFSLPVKTSEGFTTFFSEEPFIMPEGLEGTTVGYNETSGTLTFDYEYQSGDVVPAATPLLIHSKSGAGAFTFTYAASTLQADNSRNCLHGSATDRIAGDVFNSGENLYYYILTYDNSSSKTGLGFYWGADGGLPNFTNKAGKAFLALPRNAANAKGFTLGAGVSNGIEHAAVPNGSSTAAIFSISGIPVSTTSLSSGNLPAGIYVVGNKKVVVE